MTRQLRGAPLLITHPSLATELADRRIASLVTHGMGHKVRWQCENGHSWRARINSRAQGARCPYCAHQLPWPGETDLDTTHPELSSELVDPEIGRLVSAGSRRKVRWRCPDGHEWLAEVRIRVKGAPCPTC